MRLWSVLLKNSTRPIFDRVSRVVAWFDRRPFLVRSAIEWAIVLVISIAAVALAVLLSDAIGG